MIKNTLKLMSLIISECCVCPSLAIISTMHFTCLRTFIWATARDFQQLDILTSVDSDKPVQPPVKLRNSKQCSVSSSTVIEYSSDKQRLWSVCAYAQAGLSLCWSHIPNCWNSHALAQFSKWLTDTVIYTGSQILYNSQNGPPVSHVLHRLI